MAGGLLVIVTWRNQLMKDFHEFGKILGNSEINGAAP
jgi:hypothetical protein